DDRNGSDRADHASVALLLQKPEERAVAVHQFLNTGTVDVALLRERIERLNCRAHWSDPMGARRAPLVLGVTRFLLADGLSHATLREFHELCVTYVLWNWSCLTRLACRN